MQDLSFRVWDKDLCKYVSGAEFGAARMSIEPDEKDGRVFSFNTLFPGRYTFEQWTGVMDKRGTGIFVGDIVSSYTGDMLSKVEQLPDGEYTMRPIGRIGGERSLFEDMGLVEIVGNIHENPELLEEAEKDD